LVKLISVAVELMGSSGQAGHIPTISEYSCLANSQGE
jgi:hypothetical protein